MNEQPLVSICTTFFSAERYIYRVLESALQQTYKNIELVVVDNASVDGSAEIVKRYAAKDPRVVYFRNERDAGFPGSLKKSFELAKGKFVMMIGADDWLARNYIEEGVKVFEKFPDAAGVIPRLVSLIETAPDHFVLESETFAQFTPSRAYAAEWFVKRMYRPTHLYVSALALLHKDDAVRSLEYFLEKYRDTSSPVVSPELRDLYKKGFGIDAIMFLEILTRHKYFVFASSLHHMKTTGGQTIHLDLGQESLAKVIMHYREYFLTFAFVYKPYWLRFYRGMKIFLGTEAVTSIILRLLRSGSHSFLRDRERAKSEARAFVKEFSEFEIGCIFVLAAIRLVGRGMEFILRKFGYGTRAAGPRENYFNRSHFLDAEGRFTAR